ncbi:MAG: SDR family oxidoreductase [Actinomycetota bacterium]|nr:SDR family oxidoreductase [Actinomycetota bacterium]
MTSEIEARAACRTPLARAGRHADAAALVSFLLSRDGPFINGQVLTPDGGHRIAAGSWPR